MENPGAGQGVGSPEDPVLDVLPEVTARTSKPDVVKWAMGLTTLVSVGYIAIDRLGSGINSFAVVMGVMVLMVGLMLVGAVSTGVKDKKGPARVVIWSVAIMFAGSIALLGTIVILRWPSHIAVLVFPEWDQKSLGGKPLAYHSFYPVVVLNDGTLTLDKNKFNDAVVFLLQNRDDRSAADLIYLGDANNIEARLTQAEVDEYSRLIDRYSNVVSKEIHRERDIIFETYTQVVDGVGKTFSGTGIEIVLHDTRDPIHSVVTVQNPISGRRRNSPTTNFGIELIRRYAKRPNYNGESYIAYPLVLGDGREIKSTTIPIFDANYGLIGFVCINIDLSVFSEERSDEELINFFSAFAAVKENADINEIVDNARNR